MVPMWRSYPPFFVLMGLGCHPQNSKVGCTAFREKFPINGNGLETRKMKPEDYSRTVIGM